MKKSKNFKILTKQFLIKEYVKNKKSKLKIAEKVKCSSTWVHILMKKYNIKSRTLKEARKNRYGKNSPNYKNGYTMKIHHCKDCNNPISCVSAEKGKGRCGSCSHRGRKNPMFGKVTHGKRDYYKKIYMRSSYEIIYAKWLDHRKVKWQYEVKTFDLGNTTYTPDFYLPNRDRYIEVKGWWRDNAGQKYKLFKKQYPNIHISLIMKPEIQRMKSDLIELGIKL